MYDNPPVHNIKERGKQIKKRDAARKEAADALATANDKAENRRKTVEKAQEGGRRKTERTLDGSLDKPRKGRRDQSDDRSERRDSGKDRKSRDREERSDRRKSDDRMSDRASRDGARDDKGKKGKGKKDNGVATDVYSREAGWQDARNERRQEQTSRAIGYTPQGVPERPEAIHAYVQIDRAPRPEKDTTWDRLELSIGTNDGADVDKLTRFIIRTSGIASKDIRNVHVFEDKSRIQVVRYRSQEVVDEIFGQSFNNRRRVLITNLSDKKD